MSSDRGLDPMLTSKRGGSNDEGGDILDGDATSWGTANQHKRKATAPEAIVRKRRLRITDDCGLCGNEHARKVLVHIACACDTYCCRPCFNRYLHEQLKRGEMPKCCNGAEIRYIDYSPHISTRNKNLFEAVAEELASTAKLYCGGCGSYIRTKSIKDQYGNCDYCKRKTCVDCRLTKESHLGIHKICPPIVRDPVMEGLRNRFRWKCCPKCYVTIEKKQGCDALRCRCGCRFMYCCGERGDACHCRPKSTA